MITFQVTKSKSCIIARDVSKLVSVKLRSSAITNKFHIIAKFIQDLSNYHGEEFDNWFENLLVPYCNRESDRYQILSKNIPAIREYVDDYIENLGVDFDSFVDESKTKKTSILFTASEIKELAKLSGYMKVYSIFSNCEKIDLDKHLDKAIYNSFISDVSYDIIVKIFEVIRTKTYRYNLSDKFMWDYVKTVQCKSIDFHITNIFNFIMNNILVLCEPDKNPITFFVTVADESVRWVLRSVYKETVVYTDSITLEDLQTSTSIDNLSALCYNDTIGRLKRASLDLIFDRLSCGEEEVKLDRRLKALQFISPLCNFLVFPVLSKITGVPYEHISMMSPEHAALLSVYANYLFTSVFKERFIHLFELLNYTPKAQPTIMTTYKIRNIHRFFEVQQEIGNFYGFSCKVVPANLLSSFVGKVIKLGYLNILTGEEKVALQQQKVELDIIEFFPRFFADCFSRELEHMKYLMYKDL